MLLRALTHWSVRPVLTHKFELDVVLFFALFEGRPGQTPCCKSMCKAKQDQCKYDHTHDNHIVADRRPDVQPTAVVLNQEEEMLQKRRGGLTFNILYLLHVCLF